MTYKQSCRTNEFVDQLKEEAEFLRACEGKDGKKFCSASHQPGIIWEPVAKDRNFECYLCSIKATSQTTNGKRVYACDKCMWKLK